MSNEPDEAQSEVERLRARVKALEAELIEVEAWANNAVAQAQVRTYWLDRYHIDLNQLMRRRSAERIRATARAIRAIHRRLSGRESQDCQ